MNRDYDHTSLTSCASATAIEQTLSMPLKSVRDRLIQNCIAILTAYRKFCATNSAPTQLILPESYKVYPVMCLASLKSAAFRTGSDVTVDLRVHQMRLLRSMGVASSVAFLYPRFYPIHDMAADVSGNAGAVCTLTWI